jgi:hypothetical protein
MARGGEAMIIIPPDEADEFLANESGTKFAPEQLDFFRQAKKNYRDWMQKEGAKR